MLAPTLVDRLVGVIDLKNGQAVHAVAGRRDRYQPIPIVGGDPKDLARRYFDLGIRRIYIADLDAIEHSKPQVELISHLSNECRAFEETVLDVGWNGKSAELVDLLGVDHSSMRWVVPTESATSQSCLVEACKVVPANRILLSLDYRMGKLVSHDGDQSAWVGASSSLGLGGVIVLDLADVGTGSGGTTAPICKRIRSTLPALRIYSGGGLRNAKDVQSLLDTGCDYCLVATSIHALMDR